MEKKRLIILLSVTLVFIIAILISIFYSNNRYSVSFETGTNDVLITQYIDKDDKVNEPIAPEKEGFVFKEWQLDGKKFDFNSKVESDIILTAKWIKEEYITVSFNTNSNFKIDPIKVLKGDVIELKTPKKDGYEFIGWFLNDKLYNNEELYDNVTLDALYKNDKINDTYKVGNKVTIIGEYSNTSNYTSETFEFNKKAIGWNREILDININNDYPYVVGNEFGITGFFKANSIKTN